MDCRRGSRPIGLRWWRSVVRVRRAFRRTVGWAISGLHGVRCHGLVLGGPGIIGRHGAVGGTVAWTVCSPGRVGRDCLRGIICYWRPIGLPLPWLRSFVPVRRSFRRTVGWAISGLHGVRCYGLVLCRPGSIGRHGTVGGTVAWTVCSPGRVGRHCLRGIFRYGRPIGLPWLRSIVRICRSFCWPVDGPISGLHSVRCYRLVLCRSGSIGGHGPVGRTIAWTVCSRRRVRRHCLRGIFRCGRPIGLRWWRSVVRVHRAFRRTIWRLDSFVVGVRRHLDWSLILGLRTASNHL